MFRSLEEVDYVTEKVTPMLEQRLNQKGFVVLFWTDTGFVRFFSKRPLMTPDDLRKSKIFVSAGHTAELGIYRAMGYNPVSLEVSDIVPGLTSGMIDTVSTPPTIALAAQVDKVASNMLDMDWAPLIGAAIVTKKVWDKFSPEEQAALLKSAREAGKQIKADGRRESSESVEAMKKRGLTVNSLTPEANAAWDKLVQEAYPKIRGTAVPADVFDEIVKYLKEFREAQQGVAK